MDLCETKCRGVYKRIATKAFDSEGEATGFYQRRAQYYMSGLKISMFGENHGFEKGHGIDFYLSQDMMVKRDGTLFNTLLGLPIHGFAQTYINTISSSTPILLLNEIYRHPGATNLIDARVTFNPEKASYVLIMEQIAYNGKSCRVPRKVKKRGNIVFTAIQQIDNGKAIRYFVFDYVFPCPYRNVDWGPVIASYRNQLFEDYLEKNFLLVDGTTEPDIKKTIEEFNGTYCSYHFEDGLSWEQAFAFTSEGRAITPFAIMPNKGYKEYLAEVAQKEEWHDLQKDSCIVKYKSAYDGETTYSFIKPCPKLTSELKMRLLILESELQKWEDERLKKIQKLIPSCSASTEKAKTWTQQLKEQEEEEAAKAVSEEE